MRDDPLYPVLSEQNYEAIDRRLRYVIHVIHECMVKSKNSVDDVLRDRVDERYSHVQLQSTGDADIQNGSCLTDE